MARGKHKQGGQGGKLGHSNMTHWTYTEEIKAEHWKNERRKHRKKLKKYTGRRKVQDEI